MVAVKQASYTGVDGADFGRVDYYSAGNPLPWPAGTFAKDQQGQEYVYTYFTAQLASADIDEGAFGITFTRTYHTIASDVDLTAAMIDDGKGVSQLNGLCSALVGAKSASTDMVDGFLERKVAGATANQFAVTPTAAAPAGAWVKVAGIVRKVKGPGTFAVGDVVNRAMTGGAYTAQVAASVGAVLGRVLLVDAEGTVDLLIHRE